MSREAAESILKLVLKHSAEQNDALAQVRPKCSDAEFSRYRSMIAKSMGAMLVDVVNPIVAEYPDLKPPQLD